MRLTFFTYHHGSSLIPKVNNPIHIAAYFNLGELLKHYILEDSDSVNAVGNAHDTPLVWASEMGTLECVKLLLQSGADQTLSNATMGRLSIGLPEMAMQLL
jgi:ankyrin repeat protein